MVAAGPHTTKVRSDPLHWSLECLLSPVWTTRVAGDRGWELRSRRQSRAAYGRLVVCVWSVGRGGLRGPGRVNIDSHKRDYRTKYEKFN